MAAPTPQPKPKAESGIQLLCRSLTATAWVAGVFAVVVGAIMVYQHFTATANDPWKSPQLLALKDRLATEPKNEQLKEQIRKFDLQFREQFRQRLALDQLGGWLLAGGSLLLVLVARKAADLNQVQTLPQSGRDPAGRLAQLQARARWSVAITGGVATLVLLGVSFAIGSALPGTEAGWRKLAGKTDVEKPVIDALPSIAELQANSPRFRGWDGSGMTSQTNYQFSWDSKNGNGIAWKTPILAPGHNSPIVWGDHVFISGGTAKQREVFCYEASTGGLMWRRAVENVPGSPAQPPEVLEDTGYAASTAATDGRHLYVLFANGDLAALSFEGVIDWSKAFGPLKNPYGHATSLAIWQGVVIVQLDQGDTGPVNSKLLAIDGKTGRILWSQPRPVGASWATPIVIEAAGKMQIITLGEPWVIAYAFTDGRELWRAEMLKGEIVPSPVFAGGLVMAISPAAKLVALRPDGNGDVTKTHLAWSTDNNVPDISSPVSNGELVFTVSGSGMVTCFDAKNGGKIWEHDLNLEVQASPAIAGDRLFVLGTSGEVVGLEAGRQFREIFRGALADKFLASPSFARGRVFLRGETNLFCLGPTAVQLGKAR